MSVSNPRDEKSSPKSRFGGLAATILFHGALLALFIYFGFKPPEPPPTELETTGMPISMGDFNAGGPNIDAVPEASSVPASESTETNVITDENGEPVEKAPVTNAPVTNVQTPERQVNPNAMLPKNINSNPGGSGQGENPGNEGGVGNGNDPRGRGTGTVGDGTGSALQGRRVEYSPVMENPTNEDGVIVVRIWVDRDGKVTKAIAQKGSTITNPQLISSTQIALLKRKYSAKPDGPEIEEGYITVNFKQQ